MQVVATLAVVAYTVMAVTGCSGPAAIVLGGGLALSSTAVAMQVCYCSNVQRVIEVLSLCICHCSKRLKELRAQKVVLLQLHVTYIHCTVALLHRRCALSVCVSQDPHEQQSYGWCRCCKREERPGLVMGGQLLLYSSFR